MEKRENKSEQWFGAVVKSGGPGGDIVVINFFFNYCRLVFSRFFMIAGIK